MTDLEWQKNHIVKTGGFDDQLYAHIISGKSSMDKIRAVLGKMEERESEILTERIEEINSIRRRDYILVFITLTIALLTRMLSWYLFNTGVHNRIRALTEKLRKARNVKVEKETKDGLDTLEEEINTVLKQSAETMKRESEKA